MNKKNDNKLSIKDLIDKTRDNMSLTVEENNENELNKIEELSKISEGEVNLSSGASKASGAVEVEVVRVKKRAKPIYAKVRDFKLEAEQKKEKKRQERLKEFAEIELEKNPAVKEFRRRKALGEVIKKEVAILKGNNVSSLTKITGIPNKQIIKLLTGGKNLRAWKKRQFREIDIIGMDALKKLITIVNQGRVSVYQAGILFQMLRPLIFKSPNSQNPTTSINIGDNRKVSVYYPNFMAKSKTVQDSNIEEE